jgi:hypothetical protein
MATPQLEPEAAPSRARTVPARAEPGHTAIGAPDSPSEREADAAADRVTGGQPSGPLATIGAPVVQRTLLCSKPLEAPVVGWFARHAFVDDTPHPSCNNPGVTGNYAVTDLISGNFVRGCAVKRDDSPDPRGKPTKSKECRPKAGVTDLHRCLRDAYNAYADPSLYSNLSLSGVGPNSNTFVATLAGACCDDSSDSGLGWVPGWGHALAGPCPTSTGPSTGPSAAPTTTGPVSTRGTGPARPSGPGPGGTSPAPAVTTVPTPYTGAVSSSFPFGYLGGLPATPVVGGRYPIQIGFVSEGVNCRTTIEFEVMSIAGSSIGLQSTNTTPLNVAPPGNQPLIIDAHNAAQLH